MKPPSPSPAPRHGPVAPWIPPQSNITPPRAPQRVTRRRANWKGAWRAGLVCALLPWIGVGLIAACMWWVRANPEAESTGAMQAIGAICAAAGIILLCSLLFSAVAVICSVAVMVMGAPTRGLILLFLTVPVFAIYFLSGLLAATQKQTMEIRGTLYLRE